MRIFSALMSFDKCSASCSVSGVSDAVSLWIYFNGIGAAVVIIIIVAGVDITFYAVIMSMHLILGKIVAVDRIMHKYTSI